MEITRDNLLSSLEKINTAIDECTNKKFEYITGNKYLTGWAIICNVSTIKELTEILTYLLNQKSNTSEAEKILGISIESEVPTICGYTVDEWITDIKTRKLHLDNIEHIKNLMVAKSILENHLSEDDKFALDMQKVNELITD